MAEGVNLNKMGMGSGLNSKQLIQQQLKAEAKDLQEMQKDSKETQQQRKLIQKLKGQVEELRSTTQGLTDKDAFQPRSASSSDTGVVKAEAQGNSAMPGSHSIQVQNLARAHHHLVGVSRDPATTGGDAEKENGEPGVKQAEGEPNPTRKTFPAQEAGIRSGTYSLTINGTDVLTQEEPGRLSAEELAKAINADSDATGVQASALPDGRIRLSDPDGDAIRITESLPDGQGVTYFGKSIAEDTATQTVPAAKQPAESRAEGSDAEGDSDEAKEAAEGEGSRRPAPDQGLRGVADPDSAEWINSGVRLSFHHAGESYSYTTDDETTLKGLAEKITQDGNGVVATAVNRNTEDNPHYILSLKSESVGGGESRITADGDPANPGVQVRAANADSEEGGGERSERASLFRNPDRGPLGVAQEVAQSGTDAKFTVDGTRYTRSSNEFSDVIDGVKLSLQGANGEDGPGAEVQVSHDVESAAKSLQELVKKYNELSGFIDKQTSYDQEEDKAGPLHGSSTVRSVESRLRRILTQNLPEESEAGLRNLSEVGVGFERNGQLSLDTGQFTQALQNRPDDVAELFAGDNGLARKLDEGLQGLVRAGDGTLTRKVENIGKRLDRLQTDMREEQESLQEREKDLKERYAELEKNISKFEGKKEEMAQAMAKLPGN